jgi:dTDP-4-amino-4,6-dideoxygalactose transaminase
MYDVPAIGLNYRISEPLAALGTSQLRRIDEFLESRASNFAQLRDLLTGAGLHVLDGPGNSHYCLSVVVGDANRTEVLRLLGEAGVGSSVYYPQPVPRMTYYREKYGYDAALYPNAETISDRAIALPVGPHLEDGDVEHIASALLEALEAAA